MMALMLLEPLDHAVRELGRALRSDGRVVIVLPATRPLPLREQARYVRLLLALRCRRFDYPNSDAQIEDALQRGGLNVVASEQRSFRYPVDDADAARLLVDSLYLPGVSRERIDAAHAVAHRWIGTSIGVPLRRLVAVR
jgi:nitric oxide reductase activation protein